MRIWDIDPKKLCRSHLLGEHRELHAIWSVITKNKKGYSQHPETLRWKGKLGALYGRHEKLVREMTRRNYNHLSPLNAKLVRGGARQNKFVHTVAQQIRILKNKHCDCLV